MFSATETRLYRRHRAYTGLVLRQRYRPIDGAKTAIREARIIGRSTGRKFELKELRLETGADAEAVIRKAMEKNGAGIFLLDLPIDDIMRTAKALVGENVILFNIRHGDDKFARGRMFSSSLSYNRE